MRYKNKIGITIIALLLAVVCSYAQNLEITGSSIDCRESSSSVDYLPYGILRPGAHSTYEWSIEGGADFITSNTATGTGVMVRFTEGTGTVTLRVTERIGSRIVGTRVKEISKNIRPTMVSVDGPTGWGAVCSEQKGVVYTATANNAQSFTWTVPEGNTLVSQSGNTAVVDFHGVAGNMVVCAQNGEGCVSHNCLHPYVAPVGDCPQPQQCEMAISAENKSVCQNDVFDVALSMSDVDCYCVNSMFFSVRYNSSVLQLEGVNSQSNFVRFKDCGNGMVSAIISVENGTGFRGGNIGTLRFKALESGTSDITPISFEYTGSGDGEEPTVTFVNGVVTVAPSTQIQISPTVSEIAKGETVALQATPAGGTWQGDGISGSTFNSATVGVGKHTLTYVVAPNGETCGGRDSIEITVTNDCNFRFILPDTVLCEPAGLVTVPIRLSDTCACISDVHFCLTYDTAVVRYVDIESNNKTVYVRENGNVLSAIVSNNAPVTTEFLALQFEVVGQGESNMTLFVNDILKDGNLQNYTATGTITIGQSPIVQIDVPQIFYEQDTAIALTAIPANGQWVGDGITDGNYFNPSLAGIGTHTLKYVVSAYDDYCAAEDSVQIEVKSNCRWEVLQQAYNAFVGDTVQFEFGLNNPANCGCVSSLIATIQYDSEKLQFNGDTSYLYSQSGLTIKSCDGGIRLLVSSSDMLPISLPFVAKAEGNAIVQAEVVDFIGNIRDVLYAQSNVHIEEKVVRTIEIDGSRVVCRSNQWEDYHRITYTIVEPANNAQYNWTVTGNARIETQNANSVQIHFLSGMQTVSLTAREIVNGEQTAETTIAIEQRIRPNDLNYQNLGDNNVCNTAENVIYTVSGNASEYHWEVPANAEIVSGQGTNRIAVNFNGTSGNIVVHAQNGEGCLSYGGIYYPVNVNGDCPPQEYTLKSLTLDDEEQGENENIAAPIDLAETYVNVYPIPVKHILTISTNATIQRVIVYDVVGGIVMQRQNVTQIDVSNLLAGNYFVQIETDKGTFTKPIVVVK